MSRTPPTLEQVQSNVDSTYDEIVKALDFYAPATLFRPIMDSSVFRPACRSAAWSYEFQNEMREKAISKLRDPSFTKPLVAWVRTNVSDGWGVATRGFIDMLVGIASVEILRAEASAQFQKTLPQPKVSKSKPSVSGPSPALNRPTPKASNDGLQDGSTPGT